MSDYLSDIKKGAILTGRLSEVHVKTLQTAPFIFFDNLKEVRITYDLAPEADAAVPGLGSRVSFKLFFLEDQTQSDNLEKRTSALVKTAKNIMWESTEVTIFDQSGRDLLDVKSGA